MKTLAFVTPWFGEKIPGGAEMELRGLTSHLHEAGVSLEILTTCVISLNDWVSAMTGTEKLQQQRKNITSSPSGCF